MSSLSENMVSSLMNGFDMDGDELFDRDVYGFAVRPQHREIYREYNAIYKVELDRQSQTNVSKFSIINLEDLCIG